MASKVQLKWFTLSSDNRLKENLQINYHDHKLTIVT